jgi:hypothetical protein
MQRRGRNERNRGGQYQRPFFAPKPLKIFILHVRLLLQILYKVYSRRKFIKRREKILFLRRRASADLEREAHALGAFILRKPAESIF